MNLDSNSQKNNFNRWNRKLLNTYWGILFASILLRSLYTSFSIESNHVGSNQNIIFSSLVITVWFLITEVYNYKKKKYNEYLLITGGALLSFLLIYTTNGSSAILATLFLPILISVYYFQKKKILFALALSLLDFFIIYYNSPANTYNLIDLVNMPTNLLIGTIIALGIMNRGVDLMQHLRETIEAKQDLLIKNVIMDKITKTDALTDLYNHISFHEYLEKLIEQSDSNLLNIHLAVLDIDNFKKINDTYGHRAGDAILQRVGKILKEMVGPNDFVARYGGEEFTIIFTEKRMDEVYLLLENIRLNISLMSNEELDYNAITVSIGINEYVQGCGKEDLFVGADNSLYEAKKTGKNKIVVHTKNKIKSS